MRGLIFKGLEMNAMYLNPNFDKLSNADIMEALRFLHTAKNGEWKGSYIRKIYEKQIEALLLGQLMGAKNGLEKVMLS